jgi:predicted kinase
MVGLPCSGKTELARKLELERSALRLNTDEWHVPLLDANEPEHAARHALIEQRRLAARNAQPSQTTFQISAALMRPWMAAFQRPTPDELQRREP